MEFDLEYWNYYIILNQKSKAERFELCFACFWYMTPVKA